MNKCLRTFACNLGLGAALLSPFIFTSNAFAVENGVTITPYGITDFGAGMLPPYTPGGTAGFRVSYYSSDVLKDTNGNKINNDFDLTVKTYGLAYLYMTDEKILGANFGVGGVIPVIDLEGSFNVQTPGGPLAISGDDLAVGDIQIYPLMLQWNMPPNFFVNASLQIQAPTGHYDVNEPFNAGVNHWSFAPVVGLSYISDGGFEVSSRIELNFNTKNPATDYTSGVEYKQEFAIGQHFGPWTIGLGGYAAQQITDDRGPNSGDGNRSRLAALGPSITFFEPGKPLLTFHVYKEFAAENRAEGYNVAFRIAKSF